jgi:predicted ATPase
LVQQGCYREGIDVIRQGIEADRRTGADLEDSHWLALLAEACGKAGRPEEALLAVAEALAHGAKTGAVYYQAELHRLEGELRLDRYPAGALAAEASFRRAIEIARQQQAKSWELRAATSLARLWRDQGRRAEARELLRLVHRGLRHHRSERRRGAARGVGLRSMYVAVEASVAGRFGHRRRRCLKVDHLA